MVFDDFRKMLLQQALFAFAVNFGWVLILPWILQNGFSQAEAILYFAVAYGSTIVFLLQRRRVETRRAMLLGLFARFLTFVLILHFLHPLQLYVVAILFGVLFSEFWLSFNTLFEARTTRSNRAFLNSGLLLVWEAAGVLLPGLAGVAAVAFGMQALFAVGGVAMVLSMLVAASIRARSEYVLDLPAALRDIAGVRTLVLAQGVWQGVTIPVVSLVSFQLVAGVLEFGLFFSYLGIAGALAALVLAKLSDQLRRRIEFAAFSVLLAALFTITAGFSESFPVWAASTGLMYFFVAIMNPFAWTVAADVTPKLYEAMTGREFLLNLGRMLGGLVSLAALFLGELQSAMFLAGLVLLAYPARLLLLPGWARDEFLSFFHRPVKSKVV
jgi:hypothetical protein